MTLTIMPAASACEAAGDCRMLQALLVRGIRYSSLVVLAAVLVAALMMRSVLRLWVGPQYEFLTLYTFVLFCAVAFQMSSSCAHHMLRGMGKLWISLGISVVGQVLVPVGLILLIFLKWRAPYAAVTIGIATGAVVVGFLQTGFCVRAVRSDIRDILRRAYGEPFALAVLVCAFSLGIAKYVAITGLLGRLVLSTCAVVVFYAGFCLLFSTSREREQLKECCHLLWDRTLARGHRLSAGHWSSVRTGEVRQRRTDHRTFVLNWRGRSSSCRSSTR
jgi:O-antigen/teichoic acid export membrane protein